MFKVNELPVLRHRSQANKTARTFTEIKRIWNDKPSELAFDPNTDSLDIIVETDDGTLWSALFVTLPYLESQMQLGMEHALSIAMPPVQYATLEDSNILVEDLLPETIEDTVDCLVERGIFESVFSRLPPDKPGQTLSTRLQNSLKPAILHDDLHNDVELARFRRVDG